MGICSLEIDAISLNQICDNEMICSKTKYKYLEINCNQKGTLNFSLDKENIENILLEGVKSAQTFLSKSISNEIIDNIISKIENIK